MNTAYIVICCFILSCFGIYLFQLKAPKAFRIFSLIGAVLFPSFVAFYNLFFRFICILVIACIYYGFIIRIAREKPLRPTSPMLIYSSFSLVFKITLITALLAYIICILTFMGFTDLISEDLPEYMAPFGSYLLFYSVFYGLINRDLAHILTDTISSRLGYSSESLGLTHSTKHCLICSGRLPDQDESQVSKYHQFESSSELSGQSSSSEEEDLLTTRNVFEKTKNAIYRLFTNCTTFFTRSDNSGKPKVISLNCTHTFHEFCLRGWMIVGKRETCPHCQEKCSLSKTFGSMFDHAVVWGEVLNIARFLLFWNPIVIIGLTYVYFLFE